MRERREAGLLLSCSVRVRVLRTDDPGASYCVAQLSRSRPPRDTRSLLRVRESPEDSPHRCRCCRSYTSRRIASDESRLVHLSRYTKLPFLLGPSTTCDRWSHTHDILIL